MATATKSRKSSEPLVLPVNITVEHTPTQTAALENLMSTQEQLAYIHSEKKRLAEEAKQLKATLPNLTAIDRTIARQAEQFNKWIPDNLANRILARMKAGQDRKAATSQVVEFYLNMMNDLLDERELKLHTEQ